MGSSWSSGGRYPVSGIHLRTGKPGLWHPHDIIMRDNTLLVTDKSYNRIKVLERDTLAATNTYEHTDDVYRKRNITGKFDPYGIAYTPEGTVVVTDLANHCVVEFQHFVPIQVFGEETLTRPTGIAVEKKGKEIYVADAENDCIYVFDQNRKFRCTIGEPGELEGQLCKPWFMAINSHDDLVVAEFGNHRVQVFNPSSKKSVQIININYKHKVWDCRGLDVDDSDKIYVSVRCGPMRGWSEETVLVYSPAGELLGNFGSRFNFVRGLAVTKQGNDTIAYVVDGGNYTICVYKIQDTGERQEALTKA